MLVQDIQLGDPTEAAGKLRDMIGRVSGEQAQRAVLERALADDLTETMLTLNKFTGEHPEIFSDPVAADAFTSMLRTGLKEDLIAIGVPEERIPANPDALVGEFRYHRVSKRKVRETQKLMDDTLARYTQWRGGTATPPTNAPAPRALAVNVDRTERRQAIPTQPARSTAPSAVPAQGRPQRTREQILTGMRKARGQVTA
jgi:hypothetical protein